MAAELAPAPAAPGTAEDAYARPTLRLPWLQLLQISMYWFGINAIWGGWEVLNQEKVPELFGEEMAGRAMFPVELLGALIAIAVQPTVGCISDYTMSRWGRRKPYIAIGASLDVVFLLGIATSSTPVALIAFLLLLQFSSNFAQGPFQGYVPDLVPDHQVGIASSLVGLFSVLGNVAGFAIAALALALYATVPSSFFVATMSLAALELATMVSVVWRVDDGPAPRDRHGRSWWAVAREAWGTDILRERSFVFLVSSRFFVLMGAGVLVNGAVFFLARSLALDTSAAGIALLGVLAVVTAGNVVAVVPAARISDRVGRKPVIYVACALGAAAGVVNCHAHALRRSFAVEMLMP